MEYLKGQNFVGDFAKRTLENLKTIEKAGRDEKTHYEVTQLINSLLGLIVFPKERSAVVKNSCIASLRPYIQYGDKNMPEDKLLNNLRNAIGHAHIFFEKDNVLDDGKAQIKSIIFINCNFRIIGGKRTSPCPQNQTCEQCRLKNGSSVMPDFQLTIPVKQLRCCVEAIAKKLIEDTFGT